MKPKIYVTLPIKPKVEEYLNRHCLVEKWEEKNPIPRKTLLEKMKDVEGLYTSAYAIDEELLDHAPKLKVVSNMSVGYNNFDLDVMKERNVIGTHTPYVLDDTVADLAFALMLATARRISELDRYVKEGRWKPEVDEEVYFGVDVHHATLGIIGMGRIGRAIAKRASLGFDMDVLYHNRNRKPQVEQELNVRYRDLDSLLQQSDFVVLMTPLTKETVHLIDAAEFKQMKETAIFINVSRGKTVNEAALIEALQNGEIYGAGLDVFTEEPTDPNNPLLQMDQVVALPHIGSSTEKTWDAMCMRAAVNLVKALKGEEGFDQVPY